MRAQRCPGSRAKNGILARAIRSALIGAIAGALLGTVMAEAFRGRVVGMGGPEEAGTVLFWGMVGAHAGTLCRAVGGKVKRKRSRLLLAVLTGVPALWLCGDLVFSLLMRRGYANWEAGIHRDQDGVRVGCREYTVGDGDSAILLVHGFADSPAIFQRMAPALAKRGFTCRVMRLPHFATTMSDFCQTKNAEWREAFQAELRQLHKTHRRVIVIAHSMGGAVAVDYLADHPEAADAAVLLAPLVAVSDQRSPLLSAETWYHVLDRTLLFTDRVGVVFPHDFHDPTAAALMKEDKFIPRALYREMFHLLERNRHRVGAFRLPLLMVIAGQDAVVDNRAAERFYQECAAPVKQIQYMKDRGHCIPLDSGWDQIVGDIVEFTARLPQSQDQALVVRHSSP